MEKNLKSDYLKDDDKTVAVDGVHCADNYVKSVGRESNVRLSRCVRKVINE